MTFRAQAGRPGGISAAAGSTRDFGGTTGRLALFRQHVAYAYSRERPAGLVEVTKRRRPGSGPLTSGNVATSVSAQNPE